MVVCVCVCVWMMVVVGVCVCACVNVPNCFFRGGWQYTRLHSVFYFWLWCCTQQISFLCSSRPFNAMVWTVKLCSALQFCTVQISQYHPLSVLTLTAQLFLCKSRCDWPWVWRSCWPRHRHWRTCAAPVAWPASCCRTSGIHPCPRCTWTLSSARTANRPSVTGRHGYWFTPKSLSLHIIWTPSPSQSQKPSRNSISRQGNW